MRFAVSNDVRHIVEVGDTIRFTKVPHDNYRAEFYAYSEGIVVAKIVHGITNINGQPGFVPNTDKLSYSHAFKMPDFIDVKVVDIFDDYHFIIEYDETKMADWSIKFDPDDGISQFSLLEKSADGLMIVSEPSLLFTINKIASDEAVKENELIGGTDEYKYICKITEKGEELGITSEYVAEIFSLSQESGVV